MCQKPVISLQIVKTHKNNPLFRVGDRRGDVSLAKIKVDLRSTFSRHDIRNEFLLCMA